jgi:hypothetical protein
MRGTVWYGTIRRGQPCPIKQGAKSSSMQNPIPTETARGTMGPTAETGQVRPRGEEQKRG